MDGLFKYCKNLLGVDRTHTKSAAPIPTGDHQIGKKFTHDGEGAYTVPTIHLSADVGVDVGADTELKVTEDEPEGRFRAAMMR